MIQLGMYCMCNLIYAGHDSPAGITFPRPTNDFNSCWAALLLQVLNVSVSQKVLPESLQFEDSFYFADRPSADSVDSQLGIQKHSKAKVCCQLLRMFRVIVSSTMESLRSQEIKRRSFVNLKIFSSLFPVKRTRSKTALRTWETKTQLVIFPERHALPCTAFRSRQVATLLLGSLIRWLCQSPFRLSKKLPVIVAEKCVRAITLHSNTSK